MKVDETKVSDYFSFRASRHEHPNFSSSDIALETPRASVLLRQLSPLFSSTRLCLRNEFTREGGLHRSKIVRRLIDSLLDHCSPNPWGSCNWTAWSRS